MSSIIRVHKRTDYSVINNAVVRDTRLTWAARGLLVFLLTQPDNWQVRIGFLIEQGPSEIRGNGQPGVTAMLHELERFGYLKRQRKTGTGGRWEWESVVYETPQKTDKTPSTIPRSTIDGSTGDITNTNLKKRNSPPAKGKGQGKAGKGSVPWKQRLPESAFSPDEYETARSVAGRKGRKEQK